MTNILKCDNVHCTLYIAHCIYSVQCTVYNILQLPISMIIVYNTLHYHNVRILSSCARCPMCGVRCAVCGYRCLCAVCGHTLLGVRCAVCRGQFPNWPSSNIDYVALLGCHVTACRVGVAWEHFSTGNIRNGQYVLPAIINTHPIPGIL